MKSFHDSISTTRAISPVSVADNTAQLSQIIDTLGFSGLEFIIPIGAIAAAGAAFAVLIEDGDVSNLSDAAAVAANRQAGTLSTTGFTQADQNTVKKVGLIEITKRYARLTITPSGNNAAALLSAGAVLYAARVRP